MLTQFKIVTSHQVVLVFTDEADARSFLADAGPAQDAVREQLAAMRSNGDSPGLFAAGMHTKPRKARAEKSGGGGKIGTAKARASTKGMTFSCGECDHAPFSSAGFLARHERQVHGGVMGGAAEREEE